MNKNTFEQQIYQNWADYFECSVDALQQSGTLLFPREKYANTTGIIIWCIGQHSCVEMDPAYVDDVKELLKSLPDGTSLRIAHLQAAWGAERTAENFSGPLYYWYPANLPPLALAEPFTLRQLTLDDADHMTALEEANTPEDVEEAYIAVDHLIAFGCFAGDQLVSAASGYMRTGFMDPGVLTHPDFRGKGLGKAVVRAMCEWSIAQNIIMQYRCNEKNLGSVGIAQALHFTPYFTQEDVWIK
ncbi:MAG: GNAT family N-acetyltransferase [Ardenticatenaceae bacterium]